MHLLVNILSLVFLICFFLCWKADAYSHPCEMVKMELFAKIVNKLDLLSFMQNAPSSIFDEVFNTRLACNLIINNAFQRKHFSTCQQTQTLPRVIVFFHAFFISVLFLSFSFCFARQQEFNLKPKFKVKCLTLNFFQFKVIA